MSHIPLAVLTNGALLYDPEVRRELGCGGHRSALACTLPGNKLTAAIIRPLPELSLESLRLTWPDVTPPAVPFPIRLEIMLSKGSNRTAQEELSFCDGSTKNRPGQDPAPHRGAAGGGRCRPAPNEAEMEAAAAKLGGPVSAIASFNRPEIAGSPRSG